MTLWLCTESEFGSDLLQTDEEHDANWLPVHRQNSINQA